MKKRFVALLLAGYMVLAVWAIVDEPWPDAPLSHAGDARLGWCL